MLHRGCSSMQEATETLEGHGCGGPLSPAQLGRPPEASSTRATACSFPHRDLARMCRLSRWFRPFSYVMTEARRVHAALGRTVMNTALPPT